MESLEEYEAVVSTMKKYVGACSTGDVDLCKEAFDENAVMYALRTIQNYMVANDGLPYGAIVDYPDVAERRLHVDCARKYISKDWFIRQIREMSFLKMNAIQIHFSENLGFRIECETDPAIVSDEYLTKDEVREILAEAEKYGVKVYPTLLVLDADGNLLHTLTGARSPQELIRMAEQVTAEK